MKKLQFVLSVFTTVCVGIMFFQSIITPGFMQGFCTSVHSIMLLGCFVLNYLTYKELK